MELTLNEKALLQSILRDKFDETDSFLMCQKIIEISNRLELADWFIGSLVADYQFEYDK